MHPQPLVDEAWLREHLEDPRVRIVDCRFFLGDARAGRRAYLEEHIAGATFVDLDTELADPPGAGGRHPLPDSETFGTAARAAGISGDTTVVAYDQSMTGGAARLWWLLRHFGHVHAAVLEGGMAAWEGPTAAGDGRPPPGDFRPREPRDDTRGAHELCADLGGNDRLLLDARAPERFLGAAEPVDPVAGRIPGALNLPASEALTPPGELLTDDRELVAYCGSGVSACVVVLGFAAAGRDDVKLYPGSWSEWCGLGLPHTSGAP